MTVRERYKKETGKDWMVNPVCHGETGYASWQYQTWLEENIEREPDFKPILDIIMDTHREYLPSVIIDHDLSELYSYMAKRISRNPEKTWAVELLRETNGLLKDYHEEYCDPKLEPNIISEVEQFLASLEDPLESEECRKLLNIRGTIEDNTRIKSWIRANAQKIAELEKEKCRH